MNIRSNVNYVTDRNKTCNIDLAKLIYTLYIHVFIKRQYA